MAQPAKQDPVRWICSVMKYEDPGVGRPEPISTVSFGWDPTQRCFVLHEVGKLGVSYGPRRLAVPPELAEMLLEECHGNEAFRDRYFTAPAPREAAVGRVERAGVALLLQRGVFEWFQQQPCYPGLSITLERGPGANAESLFLFSDLCRAVGERLALWPLEQIRDCIHKPVAEPATT